MAIGHKLGVTLGDVLGETLAPHTNLAPEKLRFADATFANSSPFNRSIFHDATYSGPFASGVLAQKVYKGLRYAQIEGANENEFTRSEEFDHADWIKIRSSIGANSTTAPDDNITADTLIEDGTASSTHFIRQPVLVDGSSQYTFSVFAKAKERDQIYVYIDTPGFDGFPRSKFNLTTGTAFETVDVDAYDIEPVGNGWYRCWITATSDAAASTNFLCYMVGENGDHSYDGDGSSGLYIWGAQLEKNAWPTSYIPTTSSAVIRNKDELYWPAAKVPAWIRQRKHAIRWIPQAASTDNRPSNQIIYELDDTASGYHLQVLVMASPNDKVLVYKYDGSWSVAAQSNSLTWSRSAEGIILLDPLEGSVEVLGITGGDKVIDTPWDDHMPDSSDLYYHHRNITNHAYALLPEPYRI